MIKVEYFVHKLASHVSERTKKGNDYADDIAALTTPILSHSLQQHEDQRPVSRYPYSPDQILAYSSETLQKGDCAPSIAEPKESSRHEHSRSGPGPQETLTNELWIRDHSSANRPKSTSLSAHHLPPETLASLQQRSRSPSPTHLTPHYASPAYQPKDASTFTAWTPLNSSDFAGTQSSYSMLAGGECSRSSTRPRTHSAPGPMDASSIRQDTLQIIETRRLSHHPPSLLPGPPISPWRPLTPPIQRYKAYTPPPVAPTLESRICSVSDEPSSTATETQEGLHMDAIHGVSSSSLSTCPPSTFTADQSLDITVDTPSTVIETPIEQGVATEVIFRRSRHRGPKMVATDLGPKSKTVELRGDGRKPRSCLMEECPVTAPNNLVRDGSVECAVLNKAESVGAENRACTGLHRNSLTDQAITSNEEKRRTEELNVSSTGDTMARDRSRSTTRLGNNPTQQENMDQETKLSTGPSLRSANHGTPSNRTCSMTRFEPHTRPTGSENECEQIDQNELSSSDHTERTLTNEGRRNRSRPRGRNRARSGSGTRYDGLLKDAKDPELEDKEMAEEEWKVIEAVSMSLNDSTQ